VVDRKSGIFCIRNIPNGKVFIGKSVGLCEARRRCFMRLRRNQFTNRALQEDFRLFNEEEFEFRVLEYCPPEELPEKKKVYVEHFNALDPEHGYNWVKQKHVEELGEKKLGVKRSKEVREKISKTKTGVPRSEETIRKISKTITGTVHTEEWNNKISLALKGKGLSEETKQKLSEAQRGKPKSPEQIRKLQEGYGRFRDLKYRELKWNPFWK